MIAMSELLVSPAREAGIAVPDDIDDYDKSEYPHWYVFCSCQLGQPMISPDAHWRNAEVIAALDADEIKTMSYQEILAKGLV